MISLNKLEIDLPFYIIGAGAAIGVVFSVLFFKSKCFT